MRELGAVEKPLIANGRAGLYRPTAVMPEHARHDQLLRQGRFPLSETGVGVGVPSGKDVGGCNSGSVILDRMIPTKLQVTHRPIRPVPVVRRNTTRSDIEMIPST